MTFSDPQRKKLKARLRPEHVKERRGDGKMLHYIEGWFAVAEANRIFGFEGWDRETLTSQCVWQKAVEGQYGAAYLTRVRLTVRAGETTVVREGFGAGEAYAPSPGQAHERAAKAAETDATKRALSTFGNPFGLSLYKDKTPPPKRTFEPIKPQIIPVHPKETRPSSPAQSVALSAAVIPSPSRSEVIAGGRVPVDKSLLPIGEPKRFRSPDHLRFVATQPCLICGRQPSQAHHLRYTQPRAVARKVSDEYTVPLCSFHHDEVHRTGNEYNWWRARSLDPVKIAKGLWDRSKAPFATELPLEEASGPEAAE